MLVQIAYCIFGFGKCSSSKAQQPGASSESLLQILDPRGEPNDPLARTAGRGPNQVLGFFDIYNRFLRI